MTKRFITKVYFEIQHEGRTSYLEDIQTWALVSDFPEGLAPGVRKFWVDGAEVVWLGGNLYGDSLKRLSFTEDTDKVLRNVYGQKQEEVIFNPYCYPLPENMKPISKIEYLARKAFNSSHIASNEANVVS